MVYTYTPIYYSSLHDSITSICKTILPFSFKKRRLLAADHKLAKLQSDNLKWQQDSFHQILNLMGLHKEGILEEHEVSAFRSNLLDNLIAAPREHEQPAILRDKLVFLQELLHAKCISADEYHSSKRPLLQRLAIQGAEIEARDVIVANPRNAKENSEEEWSVIDLKDDKSQFNKENSQTKNKSKHNNSAMKQIKEVASGFSFASSHKKQREERSVFEKQSALKENPFWDNHLKERESESRSILMQESLANESSSIKGSGGNNSIDKAKRKPFRNLFLREQREVGGGVYYDERGSKSIKNQWGFEGLKKWKKNDSEDETAPLPLNERSDSEAYVGSSTCKLVESPIGEGPNTREIKKKLHSKGSPSDFFIDMVQILLRLWIIKSHTHTLHTSMLILQLLGDKIKKELSQIQSELSITNSNLQFSNDQIEAISTKLPVDKAELKKFFPKSWCDRYGDVVLDVVKKEFKGHVGEMENMRNAAIEKHKNNSKRWTTFDHDDDFANNENSHPNLFAPWNRDHASHKAFINNPFLHEYRGTNEHNSKSESAFSENQNPFWSPRH